MTARYEAPKKASVGDYEYFASDVSGAALTFKRTSVDTLTSSCGRYEVVRWDIGCGAACKPVCDPALHKVFDANFIQERGRVTPLGMEGTAAEAKRVCELHAGKTARTEVRSAA